MPFIENVNKVAEQLDIIKTVNNTFNPEVLPILKEIALLDLQDAVDDLRKGNYLGNRKIDINLALNNTSETSSVAYSRADIVLNDGTTLAMPFDNGSGGVLELTSHADIKNYIVNHPLWAQVDNTEITIEDAIGDNPQIIRIRDADGKSSNIDRIELTVFSGAAVEYKPAYFWAKTTSALQTLSNRVGDLIKLGNEIDSIIQLATHSDEIDTLTPYVEELQIVSDNIAAIVAASTHASTAAAAATSAATSATAAATSATAAENAATIATQKSNEIKSFTATAITGAPGVPASATYNPTTGVMTIVVPQGSKGDKGDSFTINAIGTLAQRALYDAQPQGFSYLTTDEAVPAIYFKASNTLGDWSVGSPFGRGEKGDTGDAGRGIVGIQKIDTTDNVDTYEITYTDASTQQFTVTNAIGITGIVLHATTDNVDTYRISFNNGSYFDFDVTNAPLDDNTVSATTGWSSSKIVDYVGNTQTTPIFETTAVTNILGASMTANGTISDFGESSQTLQYRFIYGKTTAMTDGATSWTGVTSVGNVSATLTGLDIPNVVYYIAMQVRDTQKPNLGGSGIPELTADYVSATTGTDVEDTDTFIHIEGTGGTGYIAFDNTNVPYKINASIINKEAVATGNYRIISKPFDQDAGQGNFTSITPLTKIKANKLTVDGTSTASVPVFTSSYDNLITTGSKIIVDDGGTIKEVVAGTVTKTGSSPTYKYTLASTTPTLTNNPSSAYVGGQATYIYSADNYAGKALTVDASTTTSSVVLNANTTGVITSGDTVSLNSGTGGTNQNVVFGSVVESGGIVPVTTMSSGFTCNYDYMNNPVRQNIYKDTTVSDITGWTTETSLPGALGHSQAIVTKSRVYLLGGSNGSSAVSTVYTASINLSGTLGTWTTGTSLPGALSHFQAIVTKSRVYLLGGYNGSSAVSTVYTAPINADGTLGAWTTGASLPVSLAQSQAIVTKSMVYLLGGVTGSGSGVTTVYTAPINSDGTLGSWTTGTSLPGVLHNSQAIVTKSRVYLLGGYNGGSVSTVYTAPINADGTLGAWTTGTSLPGALNGSQAIVTKSRVYLLGGHNGGSVSTVYTAPINSDGTLGAWTAGTSLPGVLHNSQAIVTKSRVYLLGGHIGSSAVSTVYTAPFADGWETIDNDASTYDVSFKYTCTSPTPELVQVPTTAYKGELVALGIPALSKSADTISYQYTKTSLPSGSRSLAHRVDGTIGDVVVSMGNDTIYHK